jgi:predicted nucleic acid-binding protein
MPSVTFDDALIVAEALDRAERGVDFADALHLGKASGCAGFLTLDQRFIKAAQREGIEDVREP